MAARGLLLFWALAVVLLLMPKARGNSEGDALHALRRSLTDPGNVLQSWDPNLVNPCTWFHITCNQDNRVTRVYASVPCLCLCLCLQFVLFFFYYYLVDCLLCCLALELVKSLWNTWRNLLVVAAIYALVSF